MGKIVRRKSENIRRNSVKIRPQLKQPCKKNSKKRRSVFSNITLKSKASKNYTHINNTYNKSVQNSVIEIKDDSFTNDSRKRFSKSTMPSIEDDCIIDITDTTVIDNPKNSSTMNQNDEIGSTINCKKPYNSELIETSYDDVQIIGHTLPINHKPIELIVISDSEDEKIPHKNYNKKPSDESKSIKNHLGNNINSTSTKKTSYNSPLRNRKNMVVNKNSHLDIPLSFGCLALNDRQGIKHQQKFPSIPNKTKTTFDSFLSTKSTTSTAGKKPRPIIIDGLNVGHAHSGTGEFSAKGIDLCVQFFADRGHEEITAFIPQHRQGAPGSSSHNILQNLQKKGHICFTPSRKVQNLRMTCYDDRIMLEYAHKCGGVVVSNDNYRDLYEESDAFKEIIENRHVMITFVKDQIIVPEDQYNRRSHIRSLSDMLYFPAST